ncbi:hypothetical protein ACFQHV_01120 [Promicromonospora thailandica]|uniref:Endodeoxyribonuclease RusA n=1 Tax=Promicromonospora thailandica TaxID=765201 RepID=A0A9X2JVF0_9MICO|nr:hypothetical protein [Promicromonospora thailandica]MCP2265545.1 Endodeoxyribonuclease RusA [Promicromonospora thailandica]BFF17110.1 hypothetical protein GCM10025730_06310 [Promicromonospora thailandica]
MIVLDLPRSAWWSANDRLHWQAVRRKKNAVKTLARAAAADEPRLERAELAVLVHYPTAVRADPHNVASTVVKAAIDGIVLAGVLPDDDDEHLTHVSFERGPKTSVPGIYRLTLTFKEVA